MTLWWQQRKEKRSFQINVFSTLMMHRKANPPTADWVNCVNLIDVVFAENKDVLAKWHELYGILCIPAQIGTEIHQRTYIEMLSEMAKALGFNKLQQTDIDKFYSPQAYAVQAAAQQELQNLARGFFENVNRLIASQQQPPSVSQSNQPSPPGRTL